MENGFLGLPLYFWGALCLVVALIYAVIWPKPRPGAAPRPALTHLILRWGHSLVWVLLAVAAFLASAGVTSAAGVLAPAARLIYLVFITTYQMERRMRMKQALQQAAQRTASAGRTASGKKKNAQKR